MSYISHDGDEPILAFNSDCNFNKLLRAVDVCSKHIDTHSVMSCRQYTIPNIYFAVSSKGEYKLYTSMEKKYQSGHSVFWTNLKNKNVSAEYEWDGTTIRYRRLVSDKYHYVRQPIKIEL